MAEHDLSRREFVARTGAAAGILAVPPQVLSGGGRGRGTRAPSEMLNIAIVGAGGMGMSNAEQLGSERIVALCDVDFAYVDKQLEGREKTRDGAPRPDGIRLQEQFRSAKRYADFRVMLEQEKGIEAVLIATPDHLHAVIAKAAMEAGKHVYVQKPLTWSLHEARVLRETAARTGVVTQMGNQGHSSEDARRINEWVAAGILGAVREVHVWTNRPIWPQGMGRPEEGKAMPIPDGLRWDLYLGPVAEDVPYHTGYHPFNWRGWLDFGTGALGDMGAHLIDHPYWALGLEYPDAVEGSSTRFGGPREHRVSYPVASTVHYHFPARGVQPPVRMTWYDGGLMPPRPDVLPEEVVLNRDGGAILVGERGILMHETYGENPTLYPVSLREEAAKVPATLPRVSTSHEMNWVMACKGEGKASSPIDYASRLTETMLLGVTALRAGAGVTIQYDGATGRITSPADLDQLLTREYRSGWAI